MREPPIYIHDIKAETKVWNFTSPEEANKKEKTKKKKNMHNNQQHSEEKRKLIFS